MKEFKVLKSVYSYYFPEVRSAIDKLFDHYPHHIFLKGQEPNLEEFHIPIIDKYITYRSVLVPHLTKFPFRYPIAGSDEGIREILTLLQLKKVKKIYTLEDEYGGYEAVAATRRIKTIKIANGTNPETLEKGYWFISNPSSRDGNIISNETIKAICDAGHQVFYDMAYMGLTNHYRFDLSHPNIFAAVSSFSKPFGLSAYRIGFAFSKEKVPSLYGNRWFKSVLNLLIAEKIMSGISPSYIAKKYKPIQNRIIQQINESFSLNIKASDALLLGYIPRKEAKKLDKDQLKIIKPFQKKRLYRFCLTPYFEQLEQWFT